MRSFSACCVRSESAGSTSSAPLELCNFFSSSCSFFAIILATDKTSTDALSGAVSSKINGIGRIRTGDLRHVKAGNSAFLAAFSNFFALFSFIFGTFLPRDYHLSDTRTLVHAIHPQIDTGDEKQAIYNLFAAYIRTIPLEE